LVRYTRGSAGAEEDMPFETVKTRTTLPPDQRRKRRADSDDSSDYDDRESSEEVEKPEPVVEPV